MGQAALGQSGQQRACGGVCGWKWNLGWNSRRLVCMAGGAAEVNAWSVVQEWPLRATEGGARGWGEVLPPDPSPSSPRVLTGDWAWHANPNLQKTAPV